MPVLIPNATITRRRFATATYDTDGLVVNGAPTDTPNLSVSVQAPTGDDMQILEEGVRSEFVRKVYLDTDVRSADQHTSVLADQLIIDGIVYDVQHVWPWVPTALIPHYKCMAVRLQEVAP